jgi:hypothetical protein
MHGGGVHSECHVLDEFINWLSLTVSLAILYLTKYGTTSILFCLRKIQVTFITESYLSMIENLRCQRHVKQITNESQYHESIIRCKGGIPGHLIP